MSSRARTALRGLVITGGVAVGLASLLAFRLEDWPFYAAYTLVALVLFPPYVEVLPRLTLPIPGLAATIGFLYIAGLPIILLQSVVFTVWQLARWVLRKRFTGRLRDAWQWGTLHGGPMTRLAELFVTPPGAATGTVADWATFGLGLATRWWIASALVPGGRPTSDLGAIALAELGGEVAWGLLSVLPIYSFRSPFASARERGLRTLLQDLALVVLLGLTPFVFLIVYGYNAHGLPGAVLWSFAALGIHFMLKRLHERRVVVEEQNRRLEALNRELEHRERLSAIGKMSSVVSHQMLQQLGVIGIHADLIRNTDPRNDAAAAVGQAKTYAAAIEDALRGVNRVLTDLLVFSRDLRLNLYDHPLARVLEESVEECRTQAAGRGVTLALECPGEPTVALDKLKVMQAVVNVVRNAIEASPPGGAVVVHGGVQDGWAEIAVSDHGPGVPEADREAVFTPFFTTKEHGNGLGLAIAREFTEAHGGRIAVESRDGMGATFVLRLPQGGPAA
jgi:signal transduction histidine kinase